MERIIILLISSITVVVIASVVIIGCNSGVATNTEKGNAIIEKNEIDKITGNNLIEFKGNGQPVKISGWNISRFALDDNSAGEWLNITTNMHDEKRTINVNLSGAAGKIINGSLKPGVIKF